jgi:hypothetical protein
VTDSQIFMSARGACSAVTRQLNRRRFVAVFRISSPHEHAGTVRRGDGSAR